MEKIEKFIKKYSNNLIMFLTSILMLLGVLTILKFTGIANISIFFRFKHIIFAGIFTIFALIPIVYYKISPHVQKIFNITTIILFFTLLIIQVLPLFNIDISIILGTFRTFELSTYSRYINLLIFLVLLILFFFNWRKLKENEDTQKAEKLHPIVLFVLIICYLLVQFSLFKYSGNYPDEFHHLLTGKSLVNGDGFPELNLYFNGQGYLKGAPMSLLVAFFFLIGGVSLQVGKLVPISLGLINLLLLNKISEKLIKNKIIRVICLLLFIFSPWLIFNHFYIRHYIFLEFSLLLIIFLFLKLSDYIGKNYKRTIFYTITLILFNSFFFFSMNDSTKYIIPFSSIFGILYIIINHKFKLKDKSLKFIKDLRTKNTKLFIFMIILLVTIFIILSQSQDFKTLIFLLFEGETNTSFSHYNFNSFFLNLYSFFTVFALIGLLIDIFTKKNINLVFFLAIPLFLLHLLSTDSMQIMRGMVYILPVFLLLASYGLEKIFDIFPNGKTVSYVVLILFSLISINIFSNDKKIFLQFGYPIFPHEISYYEYSPMYEYINKNLEDYTIIYVGYNDQHSEFFNTDIDYKLDLKNVYNGHYSVYYDEEENTYKQYYTNTKIIFSREEFWGIQDKKNTCIVFSDVSDSFLFLSDIYKIEKNFTFKKNFFYNFDIYCNDL